MVQADALFAHPRLAAVYDAFDGRRNDLDHYEAIVRELAARTVLDVGCGTGTLACRLALAGCDVLAVDPAAASLQMARQKSGADRVRWLHGDASSLPPMTFDLALMTGNVAQVFVADTDWASALRAIADAVRPGGHLVFETRDPARRAWEKWTPTASMRQVDMVAGTVTAAVEVTQVALPLVSFRWTYTFARDGGVLTSESTLCFRTREQLEVSLADAGFRVADVRDAPDRPGLEFVFIAQRA